MKNLMKNIASALSILLASASALAQSGNPYIHDPSSIVECDGKYYTFGTGGGGLISEDGWTWNPGAVRPGGECRCTRRPRTPAPPEAARAAVYALPVYSSLYAPVRKMTFSGSNGYTQPSVML